MVLRCIFRPRWLIVYRALCTASPAEQIQGKAALHLWLDSTCGDTKIEKCKILSMSTNEAAILV